MPAPRARDRSAAGGDPDVESGAGDRLRGIRLGETGERRQRWLVRHLSDT